MHRRHRWIGLAAGLLAAGVLAVPARAGYLNGVSTRDGVDVIAVGDSGVVFRSVDGGDQYLRSVHGSAVLRAVAQSGATILIVGDGGTILRSTDSGLTWSTTIAAGAPDLLAAEAPTPSVLFVAGASGTLLRSIDSGATWTALAAGTSGAIHALRFVDANDGWAAGDAGYLASTANGGDTWTPSSLVTSNALYAVDQLGARVWVAGANSACWKSTDGGAGWTPVNLRIDSRSDVRGVSLQGADSVFLAGGGGFLRRSTDDGASWTFLQHTLLGTLTHLCVLGARAWVTSSASPSVMHSSDAGDTWSFATGTVVSRGWAVKQPIVAGSQRGSAFALNPVYRSTIYAAVGSRFYVSRDDGETWTQFSSLPGTGTRVNAMLVSPKDSLDMLCTSSAPQKVLWSHDGGATWNTSLTRAFGEYGIPLEIDPDHPDTVFFAGDSSALYRSTDFGHTWAPWGSKVFRSPCDLVVVPDSDSGVVVVGDGITSTGYGDLWRSNDHGADFTKQLTTASSEIPGLSVGRLANQRIFATNWSTGGVNASSDGGLTWPVVALTQFAWGTDVCKEDPNIVIYGVYSGGTSYLSYNGGVTYGVASLPGSNYGLFARDRACILAEQSGGLFKMTASYAYGGTTAQSATLDSPAGGESWTAGSVHDVTWSSTNVPVVRIEYRKSGGDPWETLATCPGWYGRWSWTLPNEATTTAEIRVSDAADAWPQSTSADFTITPTVGVESDLPAAFALGPSRPNPFTARTRIPYALPRSADVSLDVFDLQGHRVRTLVSGVQPAGLHSVEFEARGADGRRLHAGVYFTRFHAGGFTATRKLLLLD